MELTPKLLTDDVDFRISLRGYDKDEVDDFLERVAVAVGQLQEQLGAAVDRARKAEARLQQAQASPARAEAPVEAAAAPAEPAGPDADELNEELRRTLVLAQRTADAAIREAREEADRITNEANDRSRQTLEAANLESQRASDEAKARLLAELDELEGIRGSLQADITVLERHLGDHRAKVRETVQVLRRLVDDPQSFQVQDAPPLSGVTVPSAADTLSGGADVADDADADGGGPAAYGAPAGAALPIRPTGGDSAPAPASEPEGPTPSGDAVEPVGEPTAAEVDEAPRAQAAPSGTTTAVLGTERRTTAPIAGSPRPPAAPRIAPSPGLDLRVGTDRGEAAGSATIGGATRAAESTGHRLGGLFADEGGSWRQGEPLRGDQGPHTQPVAATRFEDEPDDAFLAELRKAMTDEEPLGPRDGIDSVPFAAPEAPPRTRFRRNH